MKTLFIGSYTEERACGIYSVNFDENNGKFVGGITAYDAENPSYLALSGDKRFLYAVSEYDDTGAVTKFEINGGKLTLIAQKTHDFGAACYISVSPCGRFLAVACYGGGEMVLLSAQSLEIIGRQKFAGNSVNALRQNEPHTHCAIFDKSGKNVLAADLGLDTIFSFGLRENTGEVVTYGACETEAGDGPRHMLFNDCGDKLFVMSELKNTLTVYDYDASGVLAERAKTRVIPALSDGEIVDGADIHLSRDEQYIFVSARQTAKPAGGDAHGDIIAVYRNDDELTFVKTLSSFGSVPRGFNVCGSYIVCCNQKSGNVVAIDAGSGAKTDEITVAQPTCCVVL